MYGKINSLRGKTEIKASGASTELFINSCMGLGVRLIRVRKESSTEIWACIPSSHLSLAENAAYKSCCEIDMVRSRGGRRLLSAALKRLSAVIMAAVLFGIVLWSYFFVWEIDIKGNDSVSDGEILSVLAEAGVSCGKFWPAFSADSIRSIVLAEIPELSWITVNMHGAEAEVIAVERKAVPELVFEGEASDIVAEAGGFVTAVNALVGQAAVKRGDAIEPGELLISGAVESSYAPPRFVRAYGSVEAQINCEFTAAIPKYTEEKSRQGKKTSRYAVIIGNNRINFYSDSSISDSFCDKIISVWKLESEGLFSFPLCIVRETQINYYTDTVQRDEYYSGQSLEAALRDAYALSCGDGESISESLVFGESGDLYTATLRVCCERSIGKSVPISDGRMAEVQSKYSEKVKDDKWQNGE